MDWNWFFSSFAQCGAAIIGLIGAFIISKLIDISAKIYAYGSDITALLKSSNQLKEGLKQSDLSELNKYSIVHNVLWSKVSEGVYDEKDDTEIVQELLKNNIPLFPNDPEIPKYLYKQFGNRILRKNENELAHEEKIKLRRERKPEDPNEHDRIATNREIKKIKNDVNNQINIFKNSVDKLNSHLLNLNFIRKIIIILYIAFLY